MGIMENDVKKNKTVENTVENCYNYITIKKGWNL